MLNLSAREIQFVWHVLPGASKMLSESHIQIHLNGLDPLLFEERIIFLSLFRDSDWKQKGSEKNDVYATPEKWQGFSVKFKPETPGYCWRTASE